MAGRHCAVPRCFSIPSATLELNARLWERGEELNDPNVPRVMMRWGMVEEVSAESCLLPKCTARGGLWAAKRAAGAGNGGERLLEL